MDGRASEFGGLLRQHRHAVGLTQTELAVRAGISWHAISNLERGIRRRPYMHTALRLADALSLAGRERDHFLRTARSPHALLGEVAAVLPEVPFAAELPLIGRDAELAVMAPFLRGEGPPVLFVAGEPGIGKTRLLNEAHTVAAAGGWEVVAASCHESATRASFAPLLDALTPATRGECLGRRAGAVRADGQLEDAMGEIPAATAGTEDDRYRLARAIARALENMAGPAGTLLVTDNLQWADGETVDVIRLLVTRLLGQPEQPHSALACTVRVIGAYRDTDVDPRHPLSLLQTRLVREGLARRLVLGPLCPEDSRRLVAVSLENAPGAGEWGTVEARTHDRTQRVPGARPVASLHRAAGIPLFLLGLAAAHAAGSRLPWDLCQFIRERVAALPSEAQLALSAAAVVGPHATFDVLQVATALPDEALVAGLEAACRARLLEDDGDAGYRFRPDEVREVIAMDVPSARRALFQRRLAALTGAPARSRGDSPSY